MRAYKQSELASLLSGLTQRRWRQLLLLRGEPSWCAQQLQYLQQDTGSDWLTLSKSNHCVDNQWPEHLHQVLGQEHSFVAYDCYSGFYADKVAAAAGTVKAGGLMVVMLPENTHDFVDPGINKILPYGHPQPESCLFWRWFEQQLADCKPLSLCQSAQTHQALTYQSLAYTTASSQDYSEQEQAIELIIKTATGRAHRPLVLSADRGRGKSAALGISAAKLPDKDIILCAIQRRSLDSVFKHLAEQAQLDADNGNQLANVRFMPPDKLISEQPQCDVLFVDEAATIPIPILKQLLALYPRVVFASTMAGYEGSGRGYTLRFLDFLKKAYKNHRTFNMVTPIRFANGDPLEQSINRLLLLDMHTPVPAQRVDNSEVELLKVPAHSLLTDAALLEQCFSLLVLAHYQTSANDLRQLLDAPSQHLYICRDGAKVIGVALVSMEGELDQDISSSIAIGQRRPQGHLLAQSMINMSGDAQLGQLSYARIVRIAVVPELHHQGLGHLLLSFIEEDLRQSHVAVIGTSFGAHAALLAFWQSANYHTIKLGSKRDHVSGEHSVLMVKSLNSLGASSVAALHQRWCQDMPLLLSHCFNDIAPKLTLQLLKEAPTRPLTEADRLCLTRFVNNEIPLNLCYRALYRAIAGNWSLLFNVDDEAQVLILHTLGINKRVVDLQQSKKQTNKVLIALASRILT
ncbi:GNAT family N-acetyltransferase [Pseudoalteromonas ruthenica]|uniref:GNAT family N-acetyltransferase n=1 Tax=Pseudoalteromonas ruthenica TaxID=151081 RepID=UPI00241C2E91|nr:GNAT family N-acetyltransferase [Pseudoalteromonas ruthenica]|tara:strand:+ start:36921 stop:38984 length:2064 start_codon:yes stop_codon:yes gene_type:complete